MKGRAKKFLRNKRSLIYIAGFAVVGLLLLYFVAAAPNTAYFEAENASISGSARTVSDASASGGGAIIFGSEQQQITLPNPGTWTNTTSNLAGLPSECGNLTLVSAVPGQNKIIAGVARNGLWASTNGGSSWTKLGSGSGSAEITNRPGYINYDPTNPDIFYEAGIYNGGGVYKTTNGGTTFTQLGSLGHVDYVSVDYTDPNRQTLLAGYHEKPWVFKSSNGGQSWTDISSSLPAGLNFTPSPIVINSQTYIVPAIRSWASGTSGMYRTTNGGSSWTKVSDLAPTGNPPMIASDGTIYFAGGDKIIKSSNSGASWSEVGNNLRNITPVELPDGRLVAISNNNLVVSSNGGVSWTTFGASLPFIPTDGPPGLAYLANRNAFFIRQWDCNNTVLTNAIARLE